MKDWPIPHIVIETGEVVWRYRSNGRITRKTPSGIPARYLSHFETAKTMVRIYDRERKPA